MERVQLVHEPSGAIWRKSSYSGGGSSCVEVADNLVDESGAVFVRDSKDRTGPVLGFTGAEWIAFVAGVKHGEFD